MSEIAYGPTPLGQLVFDLLFTKLTPKYLARKHRLPIAEIRRLREAARKSFRKARRASRRPKKNTRP